MGYLVSAGWLPTHWPEPFAFSHWRVSFTLRCLAVLSPDVCATYSNQESLDDSTPPLVSLLVTLVIQDVLLDVPLDVRVVVTGSSGCPAGASRCKGGGDELVIQDVLAAGACLVAQ